MHDKVRMLTLKKGREYLDYFSHLKRSSNIRFLCSVRQYWLKSAELDDSVLFFSFHVYVYIEQVHMCGHKSVEVCG